MTQHIPQHGAAGKPRAIETEYRGYKFRSRLEARWAVFFDRMRYDWTYEPEGFELPSGRYLPDFFIKDFKVYIEIKPKKPEGRDLVVLEEMSAAGMNIMLFYGDDPGAVFSQWKWPDQKGQSKDPREWSWPREGKMEGIRLPSKLTSNTAFFICTFGYNQALTYNACVAARQARFEFGAKP